MIEKIMAKMINFINLLDLYIYSFILWLDSNDRKEKLFRILIMVWRLISYIPELSFPRSIKFPTITIHFLDEWAYYWSDIFFVGFIILLLLFCLLNIEKIFSLEWVNFIIFLSVLGLLINFLIIHFNPAFPGFFYANNMLFFGAISDFFKKFVILAAVGSLLLAINYSKFERFRFFEYSIIVLLSVEAMFLLLSAADFFFSLFSVRVARFSILYINWVKKIF